MTRMFDAPCARAAITNSRCDHASALARVIRPRIGIDTKPTARITTSIRGRVRRRLPAAGLGRRKHRNQRERQHQLRERKEDVEERAERSVGLGSRAIARDQTKETADDRAEQDRPETDQQRRTGPPDHATQHVGAGVVGAEDVSRTEHARGRVQVVADKRVLDRQDRCQQRDQADEHEPADRHPREHAEAPLLEPLVAVRRDGHLDHATAAGEDLGFRLERHESSDPVRGRGRLPQS